MAKLTIPEEVFDRSQTIMAFEEYPDNTLDPLVLPSLVDSYSPRVHASFNLAFDLPPDPTSIRNYERCVRTSPQIPYYIAPNLNSMFPNKVRNAVIPQQKDTSVLPLLIAASRNKVDVCQYDVVSERNSFRKIAMNNDDYVVGVKKFGSTIFLRRHDDRTVNMSDEGHRFERMCTPDYHLNASYHQLIEGHIGTLTTLITAETDAVSTENEKAIELKCRLIQNNIKDPLSCWLQAFLGGIDTVVVGQRSNDEPPQLIGIHKYDVSTIIDDQTKSTALEFLHRVLRFLLDKVEKDGTYLLSRRYDQSFRKDGVYLYKVAVKDEERLTFISLRMLSQLAVNNQSKTKRESGIKHLQSAGAKRQTNELSDKFGFNPDTLTSHISWRSDVPAQEGEAEDCPGSSTSCYKISLKRNTTAAFTRSQRKTTTKETFYRPLQKAKHQASTYLEYHRMETVTSDNDDDDDVTPSYEEYTNVMCQSKEIEESTLSELDRWSKERKRNVLPRHAEKSAEIVQLNPMYFSKTFASVPSPEFDCQSEKQPVMYITDVQLALSIFHPDTAQVITYKTNKRFLSDICELNPQFPFYILSSEQAPSELMSSQFMMHYYYFSISASHAGSKMTVRDRIVTKIHSIECFFSELYTDLAQYYRNMAYQALSEQQDRNEIKLFLEKSKKCLEMLKYVIERFAVSTDKGNITHLNL